MRVNLYENGGDSNGSFSFPGGTLTGPLLLSGEVNSSAEAIHKQYVDTGIVNLSATGITTGTLSAAVMPALTGDVNASAGSAVTSLATTGVIAGEYTKVTVDNKGRITSGGSLVEADIPEFDWSKVTLDKPTTLAGYGITDALSGTNGTVTGFLTLSGDPVTDTDIATRNYVISKAVGGTGISTGDIIGHSVNTTPNGFLKCNGGEVSKTTYSALYSVIGDTFSYTTQPGAGKPWRQQYDINLENNGDITGWATGTSLPGALAYSQAIVTKNRVYLLGGFNGSAFDSTVYTAPINSDGTLGTWTTGTALPGALSFPQAIVTKNRVYLLGGYTGNSVPTVYTASINSDGTLGTWATGTALPGALSHSQAIVTKNRVYLLGGYTGTSHVSTVYTARINSDGTLGTWATGTSLPETLGRSQAIVTKNRVYLLGGNNGSSVVSTVYTASINSDGTLGTWATGTALPGALNSSQAIVTKNRVYLLSGYNGSVFVSTVYTAPINSDGTLGTWTTGTSFPGLLEASQAIVTRNRVYLLGGTNSTSVVSTVYTAPINGGLNDYSAYYDGTLLPTDTVNFRLPDYSDNEVFGTYYYIKT